MVISPFFAQVRHVVFLLAMAIVPVVQADQALLNKTGSAAIY